MYQLNKKETMTSLSAPKMQCNSQRMVWEPLKGQEIKINSITKYCWVIELLPLIFSQLQCGVFHKLQGACYHSKQMQTQQAVQLSTLTQTL